MKLTGLWSVDAHGGDSELKGNNRTYIKYKWIVENLANIH